MANPLFNVFGNGNGNPMMSQFQNFMNQMRGQNPQAIINNLVSSGRINQQQLNEVQQKANQIASQFDSMKSTFGF